MLKKILLAGVALCLGVSMASAKELKSIGVSVGSMGNPFFVPLVKGITAEAQKTNPNVKVTAVGYDYDLGKQFTEIDNFIAAGVDLILLNPGDPNAIEPAVKRAQAAGIVVMAFDAVAKGADATVMTNNVQAGAIACQYIVDKLGGKGDVLIVNGPQLTAVTDRVAGCKGAFAKAPDIKVLSSDQDAHGSRDGGLAVTQSLLTRFQKVDAIFAINDPTGIGAELAAKQLNRTNLFITSVDGAPDIEAALKAPGGLIQASSSQDPYTMGQLAAREGVALLNGQKPEKDPLLMDSKLVTRDNVNDYKGWQGSRD
jgi:ribose transport system substrate-binding protein